MSDLRELLDRAVVCIAMSPRQHTADEQRIADKLLAEARAALLLPPAPDGATEGGRPAFSPSAKRRAYQLVEQAAALAGGYEPADIDILRFIAPSVSPVRPKGEEEADLDYAKDIAKSVAARCFPDSPGFEPLSDMNGVLSQIDNMTCGMVRAPSQPTQTGEEPSTRLSAEGMATLRRISEDDSPPNEALKALMATPSQTGEENAGLVEEARAMERFYTDRPSVDEQVRCPSFEEMSKRECADLAIIFRRLADALASRSPIPGGALQNQLTRNPGELAATNPLSLGKGIKMSGHTVDEATDTSSPPSGRPERVRCIDAWDSFNNLVVGKVYDVAKTTEGGSMVWVIGERGFCGGWSKWRFEAAQ